MQYNSFVFLGLFLVLAFIAYYVAPLRFRWCSLLGASIAFYLISGRQLIIIVACTTLVIYLAARRIEKISEIAAATRKTLPKEERKPYKAKMAAKKKKVLATACVIIVGMLLFLKYFNFFGGSLNALFAQMGSKAAIPTLHLLLPLGISFYTLSAVSYLVDVYWEKNPAEKNYGKLLLFLTFFPIIVEGPISRYEQLGPQLFEGHRFDYKNVTYGIQRIIWGLFKKIVIADRLNSVVATVFDNNASYSGVIVVVATVCYTVQIYTEFSGCMDIVTGVAEMFGIHLPENFKQPFFANNVNEFWRRWHITLGAFLRDYIFYPISLSKGFQKLNKSARKVFNEYYAVTLPAILALFTVWFCNGIWHGAEWKYIVYGLYYYVIMVIGMLAEPLFKKICPVLHIDRTGKGFHVFQVIRTFVFVNFGMMIFRAADLKVSGAIFASIFHPGNMNLVSFFKSAGMTGYDYLMLVVCMILVIVVDTLKEKGVPMRDTIAGWKIPARWAVYIGAILLVALLGAYGPGFGAVDFIYAQF